MKLRIERDTIAPNGLPARAYLHAPLDAWYRLTWNLVESTRDPKTMYEGPPIPERERVSLPLRLPKTDLHP